MSYAALAREIGCRPRTFPSVQAALLWYVVQKVRRGVRSVPLVRGSGRPSQEHVDEVHATYAQLSLCIEWPRDDADLDDEFLLFGRRVDDLVEWYVSRAEEGEAPLAERMGMTPLALARYCEVTESVIRRRMRARGLLGGQT
jgi:hypothetical protein